MKQLLILTATILVSASALAYKDGTYNCKNDAGVPDNVYKIETQGSVPYVEIHRFFKATAATPKITESHIRGFAVVSSTSEDNSELLTLGYARLEFIGDEIFGCKK